MITADGWLDFAIRLQPTNPSLNVGTNPARGIFMHSAEGYAGTLLDPASPYGYNGNHSWHLTNLKDGRLFQHYPLTARCHHATAANQSYLGVENEGRGADAQGNRLPPHLYESLTERQIANAVRFIAEIADWRAWAPRRPASPTDTAHTLWEHNEVVRLGGTGSACPTGRIPWTEILRRLNEPDLEKLGEDMPIHATLSDAERGAAPFRSYVLSGSGAGLKAYWVKTGAEFAAVEEYLRKLHGLEPGELVLDTVSLATLRAFGATPDPLAP